MRQIARVDSSQREIVEAARKLGAQVVYLHQVGSGCPDLLLGIAGKNLLVEVKSPGGELTPDEARFHLTWRGQVDTVWSVADLIEVLKNAK